MLRMKAAVLHGVGEPLRIEEVELAEPGPGEVLVRLVACGVCHTDLHPIKGDIPVPLPIVLGHEGAGVVERRGPGVTSLQEGDHVVLSVLPWCGRCPACHQGKPYLCQVGWQRMFAGTMMDGTRRLRFPDGREINHFFCQSSFAQYAVVDERSAVKVRRDAPLDKLALLGCGVTTGVGTVVNTARVEAGSSVAIFGCGGVGLSAVMAAKMVGAGRIIAVDVVRRKLEVAQELGATDLVDASSEDPVERVRQITGGGADYAMEFVGNTRTMAQAHECLRPGGTAIVVGAAPFGAKVEVDAMSLLMEKTLTGTSGGSLRPLIDVPRYVELFMSGKLPLDRLLSHTFSLEEVNRAFELMQRGESLRSVILF